jgi:hypothetical protein
MCTFVFMGDWRILGRCDTGAERILLFVVIPEAAERLSGVSGVGDPGSSLRCGRGDWWGGGCGSDDGLVAGLRLG